MNGSGGGWRAPSLTVSSAIWRPDFHICKLVVDSRAARAAANEPDNHATADSEQAGSGTQRVVEVQVVDRGELQRDHPPFEMPGYGKVVQVGAAVKGSRALSPILLQVLDQGYLYTGRLHAYGKGLKIHAPTPGNATSDAIPKGTPLLTFVIVAKTSTALRGEEPQCVYQYLRGLGIGSGNYELWESGDRSFIYDADLSLGYYVNSPLRVPPRADRPGPTACLKPTVPPADVFSMALKTTKPLRSGAELWLRYGKGSSHNKIIDAAFKEQAVKPPSRAAIKKRIRHEHAAAMRKRKAEVSALR